MSKKQHSFLIRIKDGKARIMNSEARRLVISQLEDGWYSEIIKKVNAKKTSKQLGYYFAVVLPWTLKGLQDLGHSKTIAYGDYIIECELTRDDADLVLKEAYSRHKGIDFKKTTADIYDCAEFIDFCRMFAKTNLNVSIPDADPEWRDKENK